MDVDDVVAEAFAVVVVEGVCVEVDVEVDVDEVVEEGDGA